VLVFAALGAAAVVGFRALGASEAGPASAAEPEAAMPAGEDGASPTAGTGAPDAAGDAQGGTDPTADAASALPASAGGVPAPAAPAEPPGIYDHARARSPSAAPAGIPERVYVPDTLSNTVHVIDPKTLQVVSRFPVGALPHHVTPSWDMTRLYVNNTVGNTLTELDPRTGKPVRTIPVDDPYNLYFTQDGERAIVVAERERRLDFRDPETWKVIGSVHVPWPGVDHLDFTADGRYAVASAEFSGVVVKVDVVKMELVDHVEVGALPIDVRLSSDGTVFYVANQGLHGVHVLDAETLRELEFIPTGRGAHGLCVSRDGKYLYVSNRLAGSISVIEFATRRVVANWHVGGSPDMLQVSPDGTQLWTGDRFYSTVTVVDARRGLVLKSIQVGSQPHGLAYFPQPGRYSLGHNGVYR
jgi:YVTN family beta-propeller protein